MFLGDDLDMLGLMLVEESGVGQYCTSMRLSDGLASRLTTPQELRTRSYIIIKKLDLV